MGMPSTVYEREEVSPLMQKALRVYILREKEKRKQEAAEKEKDVERRVREEEEKRKKKEEELSTIEEIKDQLSELNKKLENLRQEKHQLFHKFKRLLNDENMKKAQKHQRECDVVQAGNMLTNRYHQPSAINVQGQAVMSPGRPAMHYNHHMSPSPSNQGRKLSDQHSADESIAGQMRSALHQSNKSPQVPSSYSLSGRHNRSPSANRIPMRSEIDQSSPYQDLMPPQVKVARMQK